MSNIQIFNYQNQRVRTTEKDGEIWFVGKDICTVFGDTNHKRSLARLSEDEKGVSQINTPGGMQEMTVVNESGLYSLLFNMQPEKANLPEKEYEARIQQVKEFKHWVTHEVLPSVRKHGAYMTPETIEKTLSDPDFIIGLATQLKEERAARQIAEAQAETLQIENKSMQPKVDYFDDIVKHGHCTNFRETAGMLKIQQNEFIKWLLEKKFIYRDDAMKLQPYAAKNHGYFEVKDCIKGSFSGTQTVITPKGRAHFLSLLRIGRLEECK